MKTIKVLLGLIIGITTVSFAQEADSIVVTYDNQSTIIPVPTFGKQTTIKMADSIQIIEFGVSRSKPDYKVGQQPYASNKPKNDKPLSKTRRFSQIEVGYTLDIFVSDYLSAYSQHYFPSQVIHLNTDNISGYKLGLSMYEKESSINSRFSYVSGFKMGFAQSIRLEKTEPVAQDTLDHVYIGYNATTLSHIQVLFPFGFNYHFTSGGINAKINMGTNVGTSIEFSTNELNADLNGGSRGRNTRFEGSPLLMQPFIGLEIGEIGLLFSSGFAIYPNYLLTPDNNFFQDYVRTKVSLGLSLTYRFF